MLTSDRPPREMQGVAERLRSRFEGVVVVMQAPDRAMRQRLIARGCWKADTIRAGAGQLAGRSRGDHVRELSGMITRLSAAADSLVPHSSDIAKRELEGRMLQCPCPPCCRVGSAQWFFLDTEKVVWEWRTVRSLIEDLR